MKWQSVWSSAGVAALAALLATGALAHQEQSMTQIQINISGTENAEFSAHWRVSDGDQVTEYSEERMRVPADFSYEGTALEGEVTLLTDNERLEVDIVKGTNRSRSSTQGKGGTLTLHIR